MKNATELLLKLLSYDTSNYDNISSGYTLDVLNFINNRFKKKDIKSSIFKYTIKEDKYHGISNLGSRGNLVAHIDNNKPIILLQGHIDTVPFNKNKWKHNPLGEVSSNYIFGRGAVDMKGSLSSMILAFEELAKMKNLNYSPMLLITSDEEANNFKGIKEFIKNLKIKNKIKFCVSGEPSDFKIANKMYGAIYGIIKTKGKEGHSSSKYTNAIEKMILVADAILKNKQKIESLGNFGGSILNFGFIKGGEKVNQIPGECSLEFAIRNADKSDIFINKIKDIIKATNSDAELKIVFSYNPVLVHQNRDSIRLVADKLQAVGIKRIDFVEKKELTEATLLNNKGIESFVIGPGINELSHTEGEEKIEIKDILKAKEFYKNIFL